MSSKKIIIIGDAHARPGVSNSRFEWLGKFIAAEAPDLVIDMGDWADMPSLSSYDVGKQGYEGRRYLKDVAAAVDARDRATHFASRVGKLPRFVALEGNHEERIRRVGQVQPGLAGVLDVETDMRYKDFGWEFVPFLRTFKYAGFKFQHYFTTGLMGRPQGGENPSLNLLRKQLGSCVQGHQHTFDYAERKLQTGEKYQAFVAGCFLAPEQWEDWAGPANLMWWKGLLVLENAKDGYASSWRRISVEDLRRNFG